MPKRDYSDYSGYVAGRTVARRGETYREVFNTAIPVSRDAARARARSRYRRSRWYQGRGVRSGTAMLRRFRGQSRSSGLGVETKFFDTSASALAVNVAPTSATWSGLELNPATVLCFNAPTQGTGASNREGRYITMESIQINGVLNFAAQIDQTAADQAPVIKLWLVLDKQTNGGTATGLDSENVYTNPVATGIGGISPLRNMLFSKRYKVLKEFCLDLEQLQLTYDGTNIEQEGAHKVFDFFIDLKHRKVEFSANAGTVADIVTNGLFLVGACSNSAGLATTLTYNARLRFRG